MYGVCMCMVLPMIVLVPELSHVSKNSRAGDCLSLLLCLISLRQCPLLI